MVTHATIPQCWETPYEHQIANIMTPKKTLQKNLQLADTLKNGDSWLADTENYIFPDRFLVKSPQKSLFFPDDAR